ncbi:dynein axonemal assembly factor 8-like [Asterias amurensis]|uniref:dynein axonemal assembly factor 8-like n=1 Tax=Asterias amurensis TaxID=7602 RepID=UPI003AB90FB7
MEKKNKHSGSKKSRQQTPSPQSFDVPALPDGIGLQPHLDSIFADVQAKLPSIDFEVSDVSSDEEIAIVSRSLKTPTLLEDDPHQDIEISPETWRSILEPSNEGPFSQNDVFHQYANHSNSQSSSRKTSASSDSSAAELLMLDPSIIHVGEAQPLSSVGVMTNTNDRGSPMQCWADLKNALGIQENGMESYSDENSSFSRYGTSGTNGSMTTGTGRDNKVASNPASDTKSTSDKERGSQDSRISSLIPTEVPTLALHNVENIDLDQLLDSFPVGAERGPWENKQEQRHPQSGGGDGAQTEGNSLSLMEKLAQLCVQQSDGKLSQGQLLTSDASQASRITGDGPTRGPRTAWAEETTEVARQDRKKREIGTNTGMDQPAYKAPTTRTASIGVSTQHGALVDHSIRSRGMNAGSAPPKGRTETVFLDLRTSTKDNEEKKEGKEPIPESVKRILKLNSPSDSDSDTIGDSGDEDDDIEAWRQNRKRGLKGSPTSSQSKKGVTKATQPPRVIMPKTSTEKANAKGPEEHVQQQRASKSQSTEVSSMTLPTAAQKAITKTLPSTPPPSPTSIEEDKTKEQERLLHEAMAKKIREQREQERATRCRLQKRLETLRPRTSSSGKYPAARMTPIVFDLEASYTTSPKCLPPILRANQECALLTVHFSTSGEIIPHRGTGSKTLNENPTLISITHQVLLTWLLSLVPPSFEFLAEGFKETDDQLALKPKDCPFQVVGLQQVHMEGELVLHVAITPTVASASKQNNLLKRKTKGRGKEETRDSTVFQSNVATFLKINTLNTVCPWIEKTFSYAIHRNGNLIGAPEEPVNYDAVLEDGSYVPPLPLVSSRPLSTFLTLNPDRDSMQRVFNNLSNDASFFWQTVESDEFMSEQTSNEDYDNYTDVQNTMTLVYKSVYLNPTHMIGILYRILQEGLDISGLRLLYHSEELLKASSSPREKPPKTSGGNQLQEDLEDTNKVGPILAIAVRGAMARTRWLDAVGPTDPQLARRTDPHSLIALFGGKTREEVPIYCPRNPNRISYELALWFGGRVPESGVVDVGVTSIPEPPPEVEASGSQILSPKSKKGKKGSRTDFDAGNLETDDLIPLIRKPPSMLTATTQSDVILVVSPIVPPICVGSMLSACQIRGYQLRGIRRLRLNNKRVGVLGLTGAQVRAFNPMSCTTPTSPSLTYEQSLKEHLEAGFPTASASPMPSLAILLRMENGMHHAACLIEAMMIHLCMNGMLTTIKDSSPTSTLTANLCFHIAPYTETLLQHLGGDLTNLPSSNVHSSLGCPSGFYTNPELEQTVVVTFSGVKALKTVGNSLSKLLGLYPITSSYQSRTPSSSIAQGLELLGLKWLASLTSSQAKELTPYEVGDRYWQPSVQALTSNPALVCIVRGLNAPQLVESILGTSPITGALPGKGIANLERIMSTSAEAAFRQATMFFRDQELFADPSMRVNLPYLPPLRSPSLEELSTARFAWADSDSPKGRKGRGRGGAKQGKGMLVVEESIYKAMLVGPRLLTTVMVIKPLAFRKHLSKILKRIAQENFTVVAARLTTITSDRAKELVPKDDQKNELLSTMHIEHLTSGPVLLLCLQRENAVRKLLDVLGPANPQDARKQSQFLWRGMYGADPINNGIHGSESYAAAVSEQKLLFPDGLCCRETSDLQADKIKCHAVDSFMGSSQARGRCFITKPYPVRMDSNDSLLSPVTSTHSLTSISSGSSTSSTDLMPSYSALCQTTCLLLTPPLLLTKVKGYHRGHIEVMDALLVHGFTIVGMRMVWFKEDQARGFCSVYGKSFPSLVKILCHGPSIAVAVQRDNAVSCFDALLGSCFDKESVISKYGEHILRPKEPKEAAKHLEFFFDQLVPRSQGEIIPM